MRKNKVSIWLGKFQSNDFLERYLDIDYSEEHDDDEYLASIFARQFKIEYYDEDFQEAYLSDASPIGWKELIEPISYSETFIDEIPDRFDDKNSVIALYNFHYQGDVKESGEVIFIGSFDYEC